MECLLPVPEASSAMWDWPPPTPEIGSRYHQINGGGEGRYKRGVDPVASQKGYQGFWGGDPQEEPKDVLAQVRLSQTK